MLFRIGRLLQLLGLIILPIAMAGNMLQPADYGLWYTLGLSGLGIVVFTLGYLLQQASRPDQ